MHQMVAAKLGWPLVPDFDFIHLPSRFLFDEMHEMLEALPRAFKDHDECGECADEDDEEMPPLEIWVDGEWREVNGKEGIRVESL